MIPSSRKEAEALDDEYPLGDCRAAFELPPGVIYLAGNSLGPPPRRALEKLQRAAAVDWRRGLIKSWNDAGWIDLPKTCGAKIAPLIGADSCEVLVCDSVSVNIFKLASALIATRPGRAVACEVGEFPTDSYILEGLAIQIGAPFKQVAPCPPEKSLSPDIGVLVKSLVDYRTASVADMAAWERNAAASNISIIWDLSHAAGVIDVRLRSDGARFAVGCGYKFLNGGPGAPAFIYVAGDIAGKLQQPLTGWMGHAAPFAFSDTYRPAAGVARFASGTPPILSMCALDAALDIFGGLDMNRLEEKAKRLGDLFVSRAAEIGLESISPGVGERRGGHVSLKFQYGYEAVQAMIARGVIGDFRAPDLMRFGFSPLFLRYVDVWDAANTLADIINTGTWRHPRFTARAKVT